MSLEDAARSLGKKLKQKQQGSMMARIVSTQGLSSRSLVECQFYDGTPVNAIAWTQADLEAGQDVVLVPVHGKDKTRWAIAGANAPARGESAKGRDPEKKHLGHRGDSIRPPRLPRNEGGTYMLRQTQQLLRLSVNTYTELRIRLRFSPGDSPQLNKIRYDVYLYHPDNYDLSSKPGMNGYPGGIIKGIGMDPVGELDQEGKVAWWASGNSQRLRTVIDMESFLVVDSFDSNNSNQPIYEPLIAWDEVLAVLVLVRTAPKRSGNNNKHRLNVTGRVRRLVFEFGDTVYGQYENTIDISVNCNASVG